MGDWTKTVQRGALGRVLFVLTESTRAVVTVRVLLNDVELERLTGADLRKVAGTYFAVPALPGRYRLTVLAREVQGCESVTTRSMTVVVR